MLKPEFHKTLLKNGVTLVAERHRNVLSVSIGVWIRIGSSFEKKSQSGISHFLEHMVFKGSEKRSALEQATVLEALGGELNGFTDKEYTCYHATVLKGHVDVALEVLSDLVLNPVFPKNEFSREKKILLQELAMAQDAPDDWIFDVFLKHVWKGEPLGKSVIGTKQSINRITRAQIIKYFNEHYQPNNIVVSVAGDIGFEMLRDRCEKYFRVKGPKKKVSHKLPHSKYKPHRKHVVANTEHQHLLVGFEGVGLRSNRRFDLLVLSFVLGGGMSSRLFQEIREKAALAYTVECDYLPFTHAGSFTFYMATNPSSTTKCLEIVGRELESLKKDLLTVAELELVKGQLNGAILIASDEMESRQESMGRNEIVFGRYISVPEVIDEIESVTAERIRRVARRIFVPEKESVMTLGFGKPRRRKLSVFD